MDIGYWKLDIGSYRIYHLINPLQMKHSLTIILSLIVTTVFAQKTKEAAVQSIDAKSQQYSALAHKIWEFAEVGYQEVKSSALLQETLTQAGFKV